MLLSTQSSALRPRTSPVRLPAGHVRRRRTWRSSQPTALHLCVGTARTHPAYRLAGIVPIARRRVKGLGQACISDVRPILSAAGEYRRWL